ncbi:methyl-accepting chemotaxis protein [Cytobacillus sp. IB215316]|uniref:methyl-accepting chemotaxis protein n=1 Tax=Cytobacillus sp. IB215316 TaxID=3097354 RepID=UPI002A0DFA91|nr:methyl-accepting chemotaxis protein [Cytobacillus sp. IB215316]MDX8361928.1 methyl-accepting chemotaxis protein [Cytobacillus sp. IB215316]
MNSVGKKLTLSFAVIIVGMFFVSGLGIYQQQQMNEKTEKITTKWLPSVESINKLNYMKEHLFRLELTYINKQENNIKNKMDYTIEKIEEEIELYENKGLLIEENRLFSEFVSLWEKYINFHYDFIDRIDEMGDNQDIDEINEMVNTASKIFDNTNVYVDKLLAINKNEAIKASEESTVVFEQMRLLAIAVSIAIIVITVVLLLVLRRSIKKPLLHVLYGLDSLAKGDFSIDPLQVKNKDEIGKLGTAFNVMGKNVANLVRSVIKNVEQVAASSQQLTASAEQTSRASEQISNDIQEITSGAEQQMTGAKESSTAINEISKGMTEVTASIQSVAQASEIAKKKATSGSAVVTQTVEQMNLVHDKVEATSIVIDAFGEKSNQIGQIVSLITDIADQTNLLSLNAAIEAARAGEHGRGFAVVADEVRKLAEESSRAANKIHHIINEVQVESTKAITAMNAGTTAVRDGIHLVNQTGQAFSEIESSIKGIATQSLEVSTVVEQVNTNAQSIISVVEHTSSIAEQAAASTQHVAAAAEEQNATMEEVASSAEALSHLAMELQESINQFKV